jgi:competence protein ComEA
MLISARVSAQDRVPISQGGSDAIAATDQRPRAAPATTAPLINVNTAGLEEFARLPGIGPARARALLELRGKLHGFRRLEDLMRVRGIGRKTFRRLLPMLRLHGETTLAERAQRPCGATGIRTGP